MIVSEDIAAIAIVRQTSDQSADPEEFCGTGFMMAPGLLITCWHCVRNPVPNGCQYAAVFSSPTGTGFKAILLKNIAQDTRGFDLATANLNWQSRRCFRLASTAVEAGTNAISIGHAMTNMIRTPENELEIWIAPQTLKGYVTRGFNFLHGASIKTPSYELDMPAPQGLS